MRPSARSSTTAGDGHLTRPWWLARSLGWRSAIPWISRCYGYPTNFIHRREGSDALSHLFHMNLRNVHDTQVAQADSWPSNSPPRINVK